MTDCMNISNAVDVRDSRLLRNGPTKNQLHRGARVADWFGEAFGRISFSSQRDDGRAADTLNDPMSQTLVGILLYALEVGRDQLKLDRRATAIENQYIHLLVQYIHLLVRPLPVADFRHVVAVFRDVTFVLVTFVTHLLEEVRAGRLQLRDTVDNIHDKMKAVKIVQHDHIERRGGRAFLLVTTHVQVPVVI